jgi:alginate O-acetyltransferase complex protein AlgJ
MRRPSLSERFPLKFFEHLPFMGILLLLFVPMGLGTLYGLGKPGEKLVKSIEGPSLSGIQTTTAVEMTVANWWSGGLNKQLEARLNQELPLRPLAVRVTNQIYDGLFSKSYMHQKIGLIVGRNHQRYEGSYVAQYCNNMAWKNEIFSPATEADLAQWSQRIKVIAQFFQKRGQTFVYLMSPSKAAYYPEHIPDQVHCAPKEKPRAEYYRAIAALDQTGVPYVDTAKLMLESKGKYEIDLFSPGGTHWNQLGVALANRELLNKIAQVSGKPIPPLTFSYKIDRIPLNEDTDLLALSNLWNSHWDFPVPKVTFQASTKPSLRLSIVGTSFLQQVAAAFVNSNNFCRIDYYYYYSLSYFSYLMQEPCRGADPKVPYDNLFTADVVVLESNEARLNYPHVDRFYQFVMEHQMGDRPQETVDHKALHGQPFPTSPKSVDAEKN